MRRRDMLAAGAAALLAPSAIFAPEAWADMDALTQSQFDDWLAEQKSRALAAGVSEATWQAGLTGLAPDPVVIARRATAAETTQTVTDYVLKLLNGRGRKARAKYASLPQLADIQRRYGVPGGPLVAFWGMESDYGANIGDRDVLRALATHGAAGSGSVDWAGEFIAALKILQTGVMPRAGLVGSYAGAIGQTQLMPSNYLKYAVDFDGDGRIDVWRSPLDALASAAVHLVKASGWRAGESWLEEVNLPPSFDFTKVEVEVTSMTPREWASRGARRARPEPWSSADLAAPARLMLPAGSEGPAFLALPNYEAFEAYNPSLPYAVGVCLLAEFAEGREAILKPWPQEAPLTLAARMASQAGLARLGYYDGKIDGDFGRKSRKALRDWQLASGHTRDGHLTSEQVAALAQ